MAQRTIGSSNQTTFFITNYTTREHDKTSCEVDWAALNILDSALVSAERFIQFRKQREKETMAAEGNALCLSARNYFYYVSIDPCDSCVLRHRKALTLDNFCWKKRKTTK